MNYQDLYDLRRKQLDSLGQMRFKLLPADRDLLTKIFKEYAANPLAPLSSGHLKQIAKLAAIYLCGAK